MKKNPREHAFLLPLALLSLLVISILAINGFSYIQNHTKLLAQHKEAIDIEQEKYNLEKLSFQNDIVQNPRITKVPVTLSGIYNLSFLTNTDANGDVFINLEQFDIFRRLLSTCSSTQDIAIPIAEYLRTAPVLVKGFGLLDLLNELSIPLDTGVQLLRCIRIAPEPYKLNLSLASEITLQAYFDLRPADTTRLAKYIADKTIPHNDALKVFLKNIHVNRDFSAVLRSTLMSSRLDHRGTVLEYDRETFAYLDSILDSKGNWTKNRNFFLWIPMN
jgi:hypothetical protein|tara:strand:- start:475 stop:1299 length:825 start_codon:yes stop_codon:yes gene_type:complete